MDMMLLERRGISGAAVELRDGVIEIISSVNALAFNVDCDVKYDEDIPLLLAMGMLTFANTENSDDGR